MDISNKFKIMYVCMFAPCPVSPELVAHQAVHDEVCRGDKAEEDVRHEAQQVIPDGEAFTQMTLLNTRPEYRE